MNIREKMLLSTAALQELDDTPLSQEFHFSAEVHEQVGALSQSGLAAARPSAPLEATETHVAYELEPTTAVGISKCTTLAARFWKDQIFPKM